MAAALMQTEANARAAEQEWRTATARYRVATFSATPGLNVVPTAQGVEIRVRYITRAFERHDTRLRLNQAVLELLHGQTLPLMACAFLLLKGFATALTRAASSSALPQTLSNVGSTTTQATRWCCSAKASAGTDRPPCASRHRVRLATSRS